MKILNTKIGLWLHGLDKRWKGLSISKQRRYTLYFFTCYLLLTSGVIINVWFDIAKSNNHVRIEHVRKPVLKE